MSVAMSEPCRVHRLTVVIQCKVSEHHLVLAVKVHIRYCHAVIALTRNAVSVKALGIIM